jgi:hypothetical protein
MIGLGDLLVFIAVLIIVGLFLCAIHSQISAQENAGDPPESDSPQPSGREPESQPTGSSR